MTPAPLNIMVSGVKNTNEIVPQANMKSSTVISVPQKRNARKCREVEKMVGLRAAFPPWGLCLSFLLPARLAPFCLLDLSLDIML